MFGCKTKSTEPFVCFLGKYIFLCIVNAGLLEYTAITLAALPVGANKTAFFPALLNVFTNVLIVVVLPVPAYPFNKNSASFSSLKIKLLNKFNNWHCFWVALCGNYLRSSL